MSDEEQREERRSREASVLMTLRHVSLSCAHCEKSAIFAMCQLTRLHSFSIETVTKVFFNLILRFVFIYLVSYY
jgi:hypothetical protein